MLRRIFELPMSEWDSDAVRDLLEAGMLEIVAPGADVIGVVLRVDPDDPAELVLLRRCCSSGQGGRTKLGRVLAEMAAALAARHPGFLSLDPLRSEPVYTEPRTDGQVSLVLPLITDA